MFSLKVPYKVGFWVTDPPPILSPLRTASLPMPFIRKRPVGPTVRHFGSKVSFDRLSTNDQKSGGTIEGYHYQSPHNRKKFIRLNTPVPDPETFSNPLYINIEERFEAPRPSVKIHDCCVAVGPDMYLVTGCWYKYSDVYVPLLATSPSTNDGIATSIQITSSLLS